MEPKLLQQPLGPMTSSGDSALHLFATQLATQQNELDQDGNSAETQELLLLTAAAAAKEAGDEEPAVGFTTGGVA